MDRDEIVKEFYTLKDVYNRGWIDDNEFSQRKRQLVDRVTNTTFSDEAKRNGSSSSHNNPSTPNSSVNAAKTNPASKDNGRKSFSDSPDLAVVENGQVSNTKPKENGRNGSIDITSNGSPLRHAASKRNSPESNGKDPGFESNISATVPTVNGVDHHGDDRPHIVSAPEHSEQRKKSIASIDALINKNSPPNTAQPTITYPVVSPSMMMDGVMPMRMRRPSNSEPRDDDLPDAPVRRPEQNEATSTHKRNYEAALGALTSMSSHIQQDEYERHKKRRLDPQQDSEIIVMPANAANRDGVKNGKIPVFIGQALNLGTLNEKDLVIKSLSEELRKTQTKLRDYEHLEREREIKRQEEERWINMVVDYPRPSVPAHVYAQAPSVGPYIQSLPQVPSLGNTVPSLSSNAPSKGNSPAPPQQVLPTNGHSHGSIMREAASSPVPMAVSNSAGSGTNNPIVLMSTVGPNIAPVSGGSTPTLPSAAVQAPLLQANLKFNGVPTFQLHVASQPPARVVYQRILKPFPQVQVLGPHQQFQNLYIEATLLRRDTYEEVPHLDGNTLVRVWNGFATFRKLKVTSTSQQSGTLFQIKFSLKQYDSANFKPMACNSVISEPIEVFSHSQYLKQ